MAEPSTILLAGGGTGGHLYPGVAVAEALREMGSSLKPVFLCTNRPIDRVILEADGKSIFLQIKGLKPVMQMRIGFDVSTVEGKEMRGAIYNTIHCLAESRR